VHVSSLVIAAAAVLRITAPVPLEAQVARQPVRSLDPSAWVSGSIGLFQHATVRDGTTGSNWVFGDAVQYRASLERNIGSGLGLGVSGAFSRAPLTYQGAGCTLGTTCDADANITQIFASFHAGGGRYGLHQVIQLQLGGTVFHNFRERATNAVLPPENADVDLAFSIGYGFGFTVTPRAHVNVVQELGVSMHQRENLPAAASIANRFGTTRLSVRLGLGN
jgi:hypothetical protein